MTTTSTLLHEQQRKTTRSFALRISVFLLFAFSLLNHSSTRAQSIINEYASQPDTWRPAKIPAPGVDAKGDLNLSIPIMTVPGRNGLNYDIRLNYQSGIKVRQQSSWIGTGWTFDPGSIVRDVQMVKRDDYSSDFAVDYASHETVQPDMYYVTFPGGGFSMVRHNPAVSPPSTLPPRQQSSEFIPLDYSPVEIDYTVGHVDLGPVGQHAVTPQCYCTQELKLEVSNRTLKDDYESFVVTTPDGTRYVYGFPLLNTSQSTYRITGTTSGTRLQYYVGEWRLIAILGRDFVGPIPTETVKIPKDASGSWIQLEYGTRTTAVKPSGITDPSLKQSVYLLSVETPTHRAVFDVDEKIGDEDVEDGEGGWDSDTNIFYGKLSAIDLYVNYDGQDRARVKRTVLKQTEMNGYLEAGNRMMLSEIFSVGTLGKELAGYRFEYYPMEGGGTIGTNVFDYADDFGFFNTFQQTHNADTLDGRSWSLKSIIYPTGLERTIEYENDSICFHCDGGSDPNVFEYPYVVITDDDSVETNHYEMLSNGSRQGGTRVKKIIVQKAGHPDRVTEYAYGEGYPSAVPPLFIEQHFSSISDHFRKAERNQAAVYYKTVESRNSQGQISHTLYSFHKGAYALSGGNCIGDVCIASTTVLTNAGKSTAFVGNEAINWGIPLWTWTNSGSGFSSKTFEYSMTPVAAASAYQVGSLHVPIVYRVKLLEEQANLSSESAVLDSTSQKYFNETWRHDYFDDSLLPKTTEYETAADTISVTRFKYAYQIYDSLSAQNALSLPAMVQLVKKFPNGIGGYDSLYTNASVTTYKPFSTAVEPDVFKDVLRDHASYYWYPAVDQTGEFIFNDWDQSSAALTIGNEWHATGISEEYDLKGNLVEQLDPRGISTQIDYGYNNSLPATVLRHNASSAPPGKIESFSNPLAANWQTTDVNNDGDTVWEIVDGALMQTSFGAAAAGEKDRIVYDLESSITDTAVIEFDLTVANSDDWDLTIALGGSSWGGQFWGQENLLMSAINNETWKYRSTSSTWTTVADFEIGNIYRLKMVVDVSSETIDFFVDGKRVLQDAPFIKASSSVQKIAFGNFGHSHLDAHWVIDNLRFQSIDSQLGKIDYDPSSLYPVTFSDELGGVTNFHYDEFGRPVESRDQTGSVLSANAYKFSRETNQSDYNFASPNSIQTVGYVSEDHRTNFSGGAGWVTTSAPDFEFGHKGPDGRIALKAISNASDRALVKYALHAENQIARFDFHPGTNQDQPEFGFSKSSTFRCRVYYKPSAGNVFKTYTVTSGTVRPHQVILAGADPSKYYTVEIEKLERGTCRYWVYEKGTTRKFSQMVEETNLDPFDADFQFISDAGHYWITDLYIGRYTESTAYLDDEGLEMQSQVEFGRSRLLGVAESDLHGREVRTWLPVPIDKAEPVYSWAILASQFYAQSGGTVYPYVETSYDFAGRVKEVFPAQVASGSRTSIKYDYLMDDGFSDSQLSRVQSVQDEDGRIQYVYQDSKGIDFMSISDRFSTDDPSNLVPIIAVDIGADASETQCHTECLSDDPAFVKYEPAARDTVSFVPAKSFIGRYEIDFDKDFKGLVSASVLQNGSYISGKGYTENAVTDVTLEGYLPFFEGSTYHFIVDAWVLKDDTAGDYAHASIKVYGKENGVFREFETRYMQTTDFRGNIVKSVEPNCLDASSPCQDGDYTRYYEYDNLNRVVAMYSPDVDGDSDQDPTDEYPSSSAVRPDFEYRYDRNGNLRYARDPNGYAGGYYHYSNYDIHNRLVETGTYDGTVSFANAPLNGELDAAGSQAEVTNFYSGVVMEQSVTGPDSTFYEVDAFGRTAALEQYIDGLGKKRIEYEYDKTGSVTKIAFEPGNSDEEFYIWYGYDGSGQLMSLRSNTTDDYASSTVELENDLNSINQLTSANLGQAIQTVDYQYDIRDRLVAINDINNMPAGTGTDEFAMSFGYDAIDEIAGLSSVEHEPMVGGNITWMAWRTKGSDSPAKVAGYAFTYDHLDRLITADFASRNESSESPWTQRSQYDVGIGSKISYDSNGNFESLRRAKDVSGQNWNLDYNLKNGSNQLSSVSIAGGQSRTFTYDYNGNVTSNSVFSNAQYNYLDLPTTLNVSGLGTFTYRYNGAGLRIMKDGPGASDTEYYVRGLDGQVLAVYDNAGEVIYWNILAGRPIGRVNNTN